MHVMDKICVSVMYMRYIFLFLNSSLETRFARVIGNTFWQNTSPIKSKETVFPKYASPMTLKGDAVLTKRVTDEKSLLMRKNTSPIVVTSVT